MRELQFCKSQVNSTLLEQDLGSSFQSFVHELKLPEYPELHLFPSDGKDGIIDLCQTVGNDRVVFECKHIEKGTLNEAQKRWRDVANKLTKHITDPIGPTKGQSQYEPWYRTDIIINHFFFCISCELANQQQIDGLQSEILDFFHNLAKQYGHLKHLAKLSVKILDWNDLYTCLQQAPRLMFHWFPRTCPEGLTLLADFPDDGTFRSYLASTKLPYYSFTEYLTTHPAPQEINVLDEQSMLSQLNNNTGLVITGIGGIGKTRLMLELGQIAKKKGWLVLRVLSLLATDAIEQLARFNINTNILLLIDYLELQKDFPAIVERLHELNDTFNSCIRYIATCRISYYPAISVIPRQMQVPLPPSNTEKAKSWFSGYCQRRVDHILNQTGLSPTEERLSVCHEIPILAVFLSYLHNRGLDPTLSELLREQNFGTWVAKRISLSFNQVLNTSIHRNISLLIGLFPIPSNSINHITKKNLGTLFDGLATDCWIEKLPADESKGIETWVTIHDVMADQIISSYLNSIPKTVDLFVHEFLTLAIDIGCLRSALYSLQRLFPDLISQDWLSIFSYAMTSNLTTWRGVRDILLQTPLLSPSQVVDLFSKNSEIWDKSEQEPEIQGALALLARKIINNPSLTPDKTRLGIIIAWMKEASRHARDNIFILRWGIQLDIESFREETLYYIISFPTRLRTQYLFCAWLKAKGNKDAIYKDLQKWLNIYALAPQASFVYRTWLNAGGDTELVRDHLKAWLDAYTTALEAQFVFCSWLNAGGDTELVRDHIKAWLNAHTTVLEAQFVFSNWLNAGGDTELVSDHIKAWLDEHATALEAEFTYTAWLNAGGDTELVSEHFKAWLDEHATALETNFVYTAWLDSGGDIAIVLDHFKTWLDKHATALDTQFTYRSWLNAGGNTELVRDHIKAWLDEHATALEAEFVYSAWLDAKGDTELVRDYIKAWLDEHATALDTYFMYQSWLNAGGDTELVSEHFKAWLGEHATTPQADFIYRAWLNAKGDIELVRDHIKAWLGEHATALESEFVYTAWLDTKGDPELVRDHIKAWLDAHAAALDTQFIYRSWLHAKGDPELVRDHIKAWLDAHATALEADFVYKAWLDARGDKELIRDHFKAWLNEHATAPQADFVYKAWLDAGGEFETIRNFAINWLHEHNNKEEAVYLTKFISKEKTIPIETVRDILVWCRCFPNNEDALWRITQLRKHLLRSEISEDLVITSEMILKPRVSSIYTLRPQSKSQIDTLFSYLIVARQLSIGDFRARIDKLFLEWLRNPNSFGIDSNLNINIQRVSYFKRFYDLIISGNLNVSTDRVPLKRFINWVALWQPENKSQLREMLNTLKDNFPVPGLWDILD